MRNIIASLDLGSSNIKLVVGEVHKNKLNILASTTTPSRGIKGGFIVNNESATVAIKEIFEKTNEKIGYNIDKVVINVPCYNSTAFITSAHKTISGGSVTKDDVEKLIKMSLEGKIDEQYELLEITPAYYIVNDTEKVTDPLGLGCEKLFVKAVVNIVPRKNLLQISSILQNIGITVESSTINPISDFNQFSNPELMKENGAIVNIGMLKTEVSIFNKGILVANETLNVGGITIDQALAYNYKLVKNDAIFLKENLITLDKNNARASESLTFQTKVGDYIKVNQYDSSMIATEKMNDILNLIKKQINLLTKKEISYIIVTGGVTQIKDFEFLMNEVFFRSAKIGNIQEIGIRDNHYASASGLIKYYNKKLKLHNDNFSVISANDIEDFSGVNKKVNISGNSPLGKILGMFYDN
ncbi:MAG: hypothetical protein R3Y13_01155 [bacterium]